MMPRFARSIAIVTAIFVAVLFSFPILTTASQAGIELTFVPGLAGLSSGESGTVDIRASNLAVGEADTVQVSLEFNPAEVTVTDARCAGLYAGANATSLISVNNGTAVSFSCAGTSLPGTTSGTVAEIDVTHIATGDSSVEFLTTGPFKTAVINGGKEQQIDIYGTLTVTDDDISAGFEFSPTSLTLANAASTTIDIISGKIEPGSADTVQVTVIHDSAMVTIDSVSCKGLYSGATLAGPSSVGGGIATAFTCFLADAPFGELGVIADITVTRVGGGDTQLSFQATGSFRTAFIQNAVEVSQGRTETMSILDIPPTATATTPSGGGGGGGFIPPAQPTATPLPAVPTVPRTVTAVAGDGSVTITWTEPASTGGAPVTGYRIFNTATGLPIVVGAGLRTHTITGLTNGVAHTFQLSAINSSGNSEAVLLGPVTPQAAVESTTDSAAKSSFGSAVQVTNPRPTITTDSSGIRAVIDAEGLTEGQLPSGGFSLDSEDLTVDVDDTGTGTATLKLRNDLQVTGTVQVSGAADGIEMRFQDAKLKFAPEIDSSEQATVQASAGTPAVEFDVDLSSLTNGADITATFGNSVPSEVASATFLLAGMAGANLDDPSTDIAFSVTVEKTGIDNTQLGTNVVTMRVGDSWIAAMSAAGKAVAITKVDEAGTVFTEEPTCIQDGAEWVCSATFTGAAGGFSDFSLLALTTPGALPTSTAAATLSPTVISAPTDPPTPVPSPTPSATATSMPEPTSIPEPTPTVVPTMTALPQVTPTVLSDLPNNDDGGTPVWIFILGGLIAASALGLIVVKGVGGSLFTRA